MPSPLETIYKLAEAGCDIRIIRDGVFQIIGFYKHGSITVNINENVYSTRYTDNISFGSNDLFQELLNLNYECWVSVKDRYSGWRHMESPWREYYLDLSID